MVKLGPNTLTLSGTSTHTGSTTISDGSLALETSADQSYANAIDGPGNFIKAGTGVLTLTGGGNLSGDVIVAGDTLRINANNGISTSAGLNLFGGAAASRILDLNDFDQTFARFSFTAVNSDGNLTITGANSTLTINATGNSLLGQSGTDTNRIDAARTVEIDMSGLGGFVWDGGSDYFFEVGSRGQNRTGGTFNPGDTTVLLADNNTIAGTQIRVGAQSLNNHGGSSILRLGQTNVLNSNTINIGDSGHSNATLDFRDGLSGTPTVTIRGTDGVSAVTSWRLGRVATVNNSSVWEHIVDFSAGELDALVTDLRLGRADAANQTNRGGIANSSFTMGWGSLEVQNLLIGQYAGLTGSTVAGGQTFSGNGTFTLNHADGIVKATNIILGDDIGLSTGGAARTTSGTFNLLAGTLEAVSIGRGANTGNATSVTRNFNFTSGIVRNLAGNDLVINHIPINLTGSGTRIFEATADQSITIGANSVISGAGQGFTKNGDGTLILAANNLNITAPINLVESGQTATLLGSVDTGSSTPSLFNLGKITGAGNVTFSSVFPGAQNRLQSFKLNEASDYTGNTTIDSEGGQNTFVILGTSNALSTSTVVTFADTAGAGTGRQMNLDLNGFDQELGGLAADGEADFRIFRVNNTSDTAATLTINDDGDRTFRGILGSTSVGAGFNLGEGHNFSVVKEGTGTWTLNAHNMTAATNNLAAPNSYYRGTILNQGGVTLGDEATLGTGALQVNNTNTSNPGTDVLLTLATGSDLTVGSLSGTIATPSSGANTATIATQSGRTFTVNQTADGTFDGVITGAGDFTLGAASTHALTLSGTSTHSGATTVSAGTLYVSGALASSAVTVENNATIGSSGTLGNGLTIEAGGKLEPTGATIGLNSSDILTVSGGSLTLEDFAFEDIVGWNWLDAVPGTYQLIAGNFSVDFGDTAFVSEATAYDFGNGRSGYFTAGSLNVVIIPEPGTTALAALFVLGLVARRRRA